LQKVYNWAKGSGGVPVPQHDGLDSPTSHFDSKLHHRNNELSSRLWLTTAVNFLGFRRRCLLYRSNDSLLLLRIQHFACRVDKRM